jgi:hypothetical protein
MRHLSSQLASAEEIRMIRRSKAHLQAAGERYFEHMRFAATVGLMAIGAGLACLIHSLVPGLCTRTASRTIRHINLLFDQRERLPEVEEEATELIAFVLLLLLAGAVAAPLWGLAVSSGIRVLFTAMAFAIPFTLLLVNRELEFRQAD